MLVRGLAVAVVVAVLDQLSKAAVLGFFSGQAFGAHQRITPFFNLVLTYNRGMSFGLFNNGAGVNALLFSFFAAVIVAVLVFWLNRVESPFLAVALGLVIGGAIGNVIERIRFGAVGDFLYFFIGAWDWPAVNGGDIANCVGVAAMLLDGL